MDGVVQYISATVQIEQPLGHGVRRVGSGLLVAAADATPGEEVLLVTADHVLAGMTGAEAKVGFRAQNPDGSWRYEPQKLAIRNASGKPLWIRHPVRDVAVIAVKVPPEFARAALPRDYLSFAGEGAPAAGEPLIALGFPRGLAANAAGFPILRAGRVASPLSTTPTEATFLLDFAVYPGNSGGPVFSVEARPGSGSERPRLAGILTQQVELGGERIELGIVTHARYVAETIVRFDMQNRAARLVIRPHGAQASEAAHVRVARFGARTRLRNSLARPLVRQARRGASA